MERSNFIKLMAAVPLSRCATRAAVQPADSIRTSATGGTDGATDGEPDWVREVRRQMPACQDGIYLQTGSFGPSPRNVVESVRELLQLQLKGPAYPEVVARLQAAEDSCRPLLARLLGAQPDEVTLTHNTTEGLNIILWSINWREGDEIITSNHEHPALLGPCYNLRDRFGVRHRIATIDREEDVVANVLAQVSGRTRLVALSHVSRQSGRVVPVRALARALRDRGIRLLLDAAQATGNIAFNFQDSGCDYYSFCGHKWLLAPKGTGGLLIRRDLLAGTPVSYTGAHAHQALDAGGHYTWHPDSRRYEYGTRAQFNFGGFAEAVRWFELLGPDRIHARIRALSLRVSQAIGQTGKLQLVSPAGEDRSGIVVLRLPADKPAKDVARRLLEQDRILVSPLDEPRDLRLSVNFFNTWAELEYTVARLAAYA